MVSALPPPPLPLLPFRGPARESLGVGHCVAMMDDGGEGVSDVVIEELPSASTSGASSDGEGQGADDRAPSEGGGDEAADEVLTEEERSARRARAEELKAEGNALFGEGDHEGALRKYGEALAASPRGCAERGVYHSNEAACLIKLERYEDARAACTAALDVDGNYVKALMRRCLACERLDAALDDDERKSRLEFLEMAAGDAKRLADLEPGNREAAAKRAALESAVASRREALKDEVVGKLKDLGNNILGRFGLSLDNFNAEKDPKTGSYSINFKK